MKSLLTAVTILFAAIASAQSSDETTIRQMLDRQTKDWNAGSLDNFMQGYWKSDSLMFIGKSGITYGWNKTLANYKKSYPDTAAMGKLHFDILVVKPLSPEYYQVIGKWYLQRTAGDLKGHYTLLLRKIAGEWVIVADHSS